MTKTEQKIIEKRCPRCEHGCKDGRHIKCLHLYHPGIVGGCGTEWAATCDHFIDSGGINKMTTTIIHIKD